MKTTSNSKIIGKLGAGAATLAGITGAHATIVQITLTGNQITESANTLEADLTGDGIDDVIAANMQNTAQLPTGGTAITSSRFSASVKTTGGAFAFAYYMKTAGGATSSSFSISGTQTNDGLIAISFNDPAYGGAVNAWLDIHVDQHSPSSEAAVILQRVIWDDAQPTSRPTGITATDAPYAEATAVPEPSGIALLALGAGGLLLRRKRQA